MFVAMEESDEVVALLHEWSTRLVDLAGFKWVSNTPQYFAFTLTTLNLFLDDMRQPRRSKMTIIGILPCHGCQQPICFNAIDRTRVVGLLCPDNT